jgi:hypothetical protein
MALPFTIPTDLTGFSAEELSGLETQVREATPAYAAIAPADITPEVMSEVRALHGFLSAITAENTRRTEAAAQAETERAEFSAALADLTAAVPAAQAATPAAAASAVVEGTAFSGTVATATRTRVPVAAAAAFSPAAPVETMANLFQDWVLPADSGVAAFGSWLDVAQVAERRLGSYRGLPSGQGGRNTIAVIQRNFPKDLLSADERSDDALVVYATSEKRLTGQSIVAAAGWCAPSTTVYDLCELETADGMIDVPEVQITRGGLRFTPGPDFAAIFNGAGYWNFTETQVMANTVKPCMEIPCPPFQDIRLVVEGLCITGSVLQRRGYPELVERFIRGALVAHMHKLNAYVIAQMATISATASVLVDYTAVPPVGDTTMTGMLAAIEMQVEDIRYRNRMALNSTVAVKAPHWLQPQLRADFSRRQGEGRTNVGDAERLISPLVARASSTSTTGRTRSPAWQAARVEPPPLRRSRPLWTCSCTRRAPGFAARTRRSAWTRSTTA